MRHLLLTLATGCAFSLFGAVIVTLLAYVFVVSRLQELMWNSGFLAWLAPSYGTGFVSWAGTWIGSWLA